LERGLTLHHLTVLLFASAPIETAPAVFEIGTDATMVIATNLVKLGHRPVAAQAATSA
jgi:hypothetical protein